jgi:hypothetical protein
MLCPLLLSGVFSNTFAGPERFEHSAPDCKGEDCAWWVSHNYDKGEQGEKGACAIQFLGRAAQRQR